MILQIFNLIFTYILSSIIIFLAVIKMFKIEDDEVINVFVFFSGVGPILISWLLSKSLLIFPKHSNAFYFFVIYGFFFLLLLYAFRNFKVLKRIFYFIKSEIIEYACSKRALSFFLLCILLFFIISMFVLSITRPLTGNDPLEYATAARIIYDSKDLHIYPFNQAFPKTGFYAPSTHPVGYVALIVWHYILQGNANSSGIMRLISPFYALMSITLLFALLSEYKKTLGIIGGILIISTPLFYEQAILCHIDPIRIYFFFLTFVVIAQFFKTQRLYYVPLIGCFVGFSMFCHSINLISLPFSITIFVLFYRKVSIKLIAFILTFSIIAIFIGGYRYIDNYLSFGHIISDEVKVWNLETLNYQEYFRYTRDLTTLLDRIIIGLFKGFINIFNFSITYWFFLIGLLLFLRNKLKTKIVAASNDFVSLAVILLFYSLTTLSIFMDADIIIKNDRYQMTIQPFIAYWGAKAIGSLDIK